MNIVLLSFIDAIIYVCVIFDWLFRMIFRGTKYYKVFLAIQSNGTFLFSEHNFNALKLM